MSEMIERVARVLSPWSFSDQIEENPRKAEQREIAMKNARAAIEAMREPTETMWEAGGASLYGHPRAKAEEWGKDDKFESDANRAEDAYKAMIGAALGGKP